MMLQEIESELYDRFGYGDNTDPRAINRLRRYVNNTYKEIHGKKGTARMRRKTLTFASVSGTPWAVLPQVCARIIDIQDRVNMWTLDEVDLKDVRFDDPGLVMQTAFPYEYVVMGTQVPVAMDPTAAAEMFIKSDNAADGGGVTAYLQGIRTGGYKVTSSVAMNGVTATTFDASITTWIAITKWWINSPAVGNITLNQGSGAGTELGRITPGRVSAKYTQIMLHPTPSQSNTYYVDAELFVDDLLTPTDEPILHDNYHWLLSCGAMMQEYQKREKAVQYANEKARYKSGVADMLVELAKPSGLGGNRQKMRRFSQLGPYFQPGS